MYKIKLLDGAMGTELIKRGELLPEGIWSASTNLTNPDLVYKIHKNHIEAGATYITTNTFRSTPRAFKKMGLSNNDAYIKSRASFNSAIKSAKKASKINKRIHILGSIAPLEDCYLPSLFPGEKSALKEFQEIGEWINNANLSGFLLETMNSIEETEICLKTISKFNLPIWVSFNLLNSEKIRSGEKFSNAIKMIKKYSVNCLLINCNPLNRSYNALKILKNNWDNDWGLYPNLGVGEPSPNGIITAYHTNKDFLNTIQNSIDLGANVIGGCCGVSPKHINLISKLIKNNL
tara:strand:+ start:379 stop:1251 length:873 start_codon:yes stop_codon:yes gene_type:complete